MIIDTMSISEIIKEREKDRSAILNKFQGLRKSFGTLCKKTYRYPIEKVFDYTTPRGNKAVFIFKAGKRSDWDKPRCNLAITYSRPEGKYMLIGAAFGKVNIIVPPHFFSRYRTRAYPDSKMTTDELMHNFILKNHVFGANMLPDFMKEKGKEESEEQFDFATPIQEGMALGTMFSDDIIILKTMLTEKMLRPEQKVFLEIIKQKMKQFLETGEKIQFIY